jgi:hypothetical protein
MTTPVLVRASAFSFQSADDVLIRRCADMLMLLYTNLLMSSCIVIAEELQP